MKKVGVKDIAQKAGVSTGTVDRVLHNRGDVKPETRDKITAIVKELGYKPNIFARSLASKQLKRIAIVTPDQSDSNPYWEKSSLGFKKAEEELESHNIILKEVHYDASNVESYWQALSSICDQNLDGIILNPIFKQATLEFIPVFEELGLPYVFIDVNLEGVNNLAYFGQNAEQSGAVAGRLMEQSLGEGDRVLIVKLSQHKVFSQHINKRVKGFNHHISSAKVKVFTLELSYDDLKAEKNAFLSLLDNDEFHHIYVPNSRVYLIAQEIKKNRTRVKTLIGYDLIQPNVEALEDGQIAYLISQQPAQQAYNATYALFNYLVTKEDIKKVNYSPIDIIIKENINFY